MKDWNRYMKLGVVFSVAYPESGVSPECYIECLKKVICDPEFEAIEITHIEDRQLRRRAHELIRQAGMSVAYCAQPVLIGGQKNLNSLDQKEREDAILTAKKCIDEAYEAGAESLSLASGKNESVYVKEALENLTDSLIELCRYAEERGKLQIEIEMFDYDLDLCRFIGPSSRAVHLAERVRKSCNNFWILPDLSHIPQQWEGIRECLKAVYPYVRRAHFGNCVVKEGSPVRGDQHPPFGYPDSCVGREEIRTYMELLIKYGILNEKDRPIVSIEIKPRPGDDSDCIVAKSKRVLKQAMYLTD